MTPDAALRQLQRRYASALDTLSSAVAREKITTAEYLSKARTLCKDAHTKAALIGRLARGGKSGMTAADRQAGQLVAREEIEFVKGFLSDLKAGRYKPKNQGGKGAKARKARAMLYSKKLVATANASFFGDPDEILRWVRHAEESCGDCIAEDRKGWRKRRDLKFFPGEGETKCLVNCKCAVVSRDGETGFSN